MPTLLKLHRTEVAQSRMQSSVIVEGHPVQYRIHGLLTRGKFPAVQAGCLQPSSETLRGCVVAKPQVPPAVALPAHR